ncbi:ATP-binding cassette domain-containing protein [Salibaculum griseiflavum]|uniref:ABC transporter ATP-binding protein n=1 Tax=Salibaculum griseiflavum TaxID=1914409 RepID=A0A2V1P3U7_9RHOB|nr:ATP-binding cassette domain-containing protein [Salibaculum griseiflavum]PWG17105.1 ABC transporter ATP-binding protein [Salibaculum griseiflavum]
MSDGLVLENVRITDGGATLIEVDCTVAPGEVLTIMGPSGVGKSTLLSFVTGTLDRVFRATGRVLLDGEDITGRPPHLRQVGILYQDDILFPHMSVGQNLAFGMAPGGNRADRRARIAQALSEIGLKGFEGRDPATLSGGQAARVQLLRVLLSEPKALLLDEAFSRLDTSRRAQIRELVFDMARARDLPVLMVTHDEDDARAAGGPVILLGE